MLCTRQKASIFAMAYGSQSCEKLFRTMRSMSSTFSTVLNFGLLGLLRRLRQLRIQFSLETESKVNDISYPNLQARKAKAEKNEKTYQSFNIKDISEHDIAKEVVSAKQDSISSLKDLGIIEKLDDKDTVKENTQEEESEDAEKVRRIDWISL